MRQHVQQLFLGRVEFAKQGGQMNLLDAGEEIQIVLRLNGSHDHDGFLF